jgi:hypothetical protein
LCGSPLVDWAVADKANIAGDNSYFVDVWKLEVCEKLSESLLISTQELTVSGIPLAVTGEPSYVMALER